jgi:hypothetical protein
LFAKRQAVNTDKGRIYILRMTLDNKEVIHKIGMCHSSRSTDRMLEILRSWFMYYRYVPETRLRLDYETGVPLLFEQHIHEILKEFKWVPDKKVDGAQEMFKDLDEDEVIEYIKDFDYSTLASGKLSMATDDIIYITSKTEVPYEEDDIPF